MNGLKRYATNPWIQFFLSFIVARLLLFSPYVTWDSFHYLELSLNPVFGDTHPLVFGLILKFLAWITQSVGWPLAFREILFLIHFTLLFLICENFKIDLKRDSRAVSSLKFLFWLFAFPGLLVFINAVWTEMFYFGLILLFRRLISNERLVQRTLPFSLICGLVFLLSYQIRYQLLLLPLSMLATAAYTWIKNRTLLKSYVAAGIAGLMAIAVSNQILKQALPNNDGNHFIMVNNAETSSFCALRCGNPLFQMDCSSPEQKAAIDALSCSDVLLGYAKRPPEKQNVANLTDIFRGLGPLKTVQWLAVAPFTYFLDIHKNWGLEIGRFEFLKDDASNFYKAAAAYYTPNLQVAGAQPSELFLLVQNYLTAAHFDFYLFHFISVFVLIYCGVILFKSNDRVVESLCFLTLGTWLIFAYFNPHVPFRFLMQIIVSGAIAIATFNDKTVAKTEKRPT